MFQLGITPHHLHSCIVFISVPFFHMSTFWHHLNLQSNCQTLVVSRLTT